MKAFIAYNTHAEYDRGGFSNTWVVEAYDSRHAAQVAVGRLTGKAARIIAKRSIGDFIAAAKPFSGKSRRLINTGCTADDEHYLGEVMIAYNGEGDPV